jgi:type VI secretion system secreted protein VgrG
MSRSIEVEPAVAQANRTTHGLPRVMEITTPMGDDVLLFHSMHAREELSRLSEYQVSLLSKHSDLELNDLLGKAVSIKLAMADDRIREFNGYVTRLGQLGMHGRYYEYFATVRPWLWFLTRTSDCRVFQKMTVRQIVEKVFADHTPATFEFHLTEAAYRTLPYCVQYRETDFNFVSRLLEQAGIYYYFTHATGKNTMVLTDSYSGHDLFPGCEHLPVIAPERLVRADTEHISHWEFSRQVQPGAYAHRDYDLERPTVDLLAKKTQPQPHALNDYEIYDYPGNYLKKAEGDLYAGVRIDELASRFETVAGSSNARGIAVGSLLNVTSHTRDDQNREYLITSADYDLAFSDYESMPDNRPAEYRCSFVAISSQQQFRPERLTPKPFMQGPQTAVVVGPAGDEIHSEKFAQVKVQFHWDRYGKRDENSSCWIRVVQPWAGKGWGSVIIPRIGHEVMVEFIEGDPDQPIVTGSIYNGENLPPYPQPGAAVVSGLKTNTHKGTGSNEMSMDDTAGKEMVTIHGQYDMSTTVEHDQTTTVHNNRTDKIDVDDAETVGSNQSLSVGGNRSSTVGKNETATVALTRTHSVGVNEAVSVGGAQEITVGGFQAISVGGAQSINVGGAQSINVGGDQSTAVGGGRSAKVGKDDVTNVANNCGIDAGDSIVLKTGGASITMRSDGTIAIKGTDIIIEGTGKINAQAASDVVIKGSKVSID